MNLLTQLASDFLINKTTLLQLLRTFDFSEEFLEEFRHDRICIDEELIRRKIRLSVDEETFFQDLFCHEDGIHLVFYAHLYLPRFIRFRLSFDVKIIALILNSQHQIVQLMINNIQMKSFNRLLKPFRSCIQSKAKSVVIDELERLCNEQHIPYERLFTDLKRPLTYELNLSQLKELDQLRERYLIIGNRSILDFIQITYVEHREQAVVLGYRLNNILNDENDSTIQFVEC